MKPIPIAMGAVVLSCAPLSAQIVGTESFTYPDGPIADRNGGIGFNYDNYDHVTTAFTSDWDALFGTPQVVAGALVTNNAGAKREFNGTLEGSVGTEGQDDTERTGAIRATGRVFYRFTLTRAGGSWSGASSYDFGAERVFFGVPGGNGPSGGLEFGVEVSGVATYFSGIPADNSTHTLVTVLDFDRDYVGIWVDPDPDDAYDIDTGASTADAGGSYTGTNWATAVRLASGGQATWDDLIVALDPAGVGLGVPTDGDVLPDAWELTYFGNLDQTDSDDPDGDGRTNLQEFNDGTDPTKKDTDGDGLDDGAEVTAGTDPLNPDCDSDGLSDGDEVLVHTTDPFNSDTDSGGTSDATEVALGTNPKLGTDDPATAGDLDFIGSEDFDSYPQNTPIGGKSGGAPWDYDNSKVNDTFTGHTKKSSDWTNVTAAPVVMNGRLFTNNSSAKREFHGGAASPFAVTGEIAGTFAPVLAPEPSSNGRDVLYCKVQLTRRAGADWSGLSLLNFASENFFIGVNYADPDGDGPLPAGFAFALQESANTMNRAVVMNGGTPLAPANDTSHTIVAKFDFAANLVSMYVDPDLSLAEPLTPGASITPVSTIALTGTSVRLGSGGPAEWDGLVVGTTWQSLNVVPQDTDGDGMPDAYEIQVGLDPTRNDAADDNDADGLTNYQEYLAGLPPNNPDSDGDGLNDGTEEAAAGTNPRNPDTDGDGLSDGDEVLTYHTSPLLRDTDGDGQSDPSEIDGTPDGVTSDPTDANDTVGLPLQLIGTDDFTYANGAVEGLLGGSYFDYENYLTNGPFTGHTAVSAPWTGNATIAGGALVTMESSAIRDFNGAIDGATNSKTLGAVNQEASHDASVVYFKAQMVRAAGAAFSLIGPDDFGTERLAFGVVDDGTGLAWGIREGTAYTTDAGALAVQSGRTYTVVGKLDFDADRLSLWVDPNLAQPEANNPAQVVRTYGGTNWASGVKFSSTGTGATTWDNLVVANSWAQLSPAVVAPSGLKLTVTGYNAATGVLSLTATGLEAGGSYRLTSSNTLQDFLPLTPAVEFTSTTAQPLQVTVTPNTVPKRFFRVEEVPR